MSKNVQTGHGTTFNFQKKIVLHDEGVWENIITVYS